MKCAWKEFLSILPMKIRRETDALGRDSAQQLRLRLGGRPELTLKDRSVFLDARINREDLDFCINTAGNYSPWAWGTIGKGYITAPGGHRIGICGEAVVKGSEVVHIRNISSLCIRVARDLPGIAREIVNIPGSILILGAPGWGKTTLLRDLIREKSESGLHVAVVDEREELFPAGFDRGCRTEVMSLCPRKAGLDMLLRTMGPEILAVDEITSEEDCESLRMVARCGVLLLATAHAANLEEYRSRAVYSPLIQENLFDNIVILHRDKSWHLERSKGCITNGSVRY